ncbi:MAG TPA: PEP-CTERM sorting domain-containing protein [Bryobacteraceae bacterium]|nr:PEP-CTERM sorting domain-containing protein [Bryobacteraceae bacterium]
MCRLIAVVVLASVGSIGASPLLVEANVSMIGVDNLTISDLQTIIPENVFFNDGDILLSGGASAHSGYLSKGTAADILNQNSFPFAGAPFAFASAGSIDVVTPGTSAPVSSGFLVLDFLVSGSNSGVFMGSADPATGSSSFGFTRLQVCDNGHNASGSVRCDGAGQTSTFSGGSYVNLPVEFKIPVIIGESITLFVGQETQVGVVPHALVTSFSGSSDFAHTSTLTSVQLTDLDGNPLPDPTLVADSGTIYPLGSTSAAVPEPSMFLLAGAALVACYLRRRSWTALSRRSS